MISCIIIDDHPLAREALRGMIAHVPWLHCVGEATHCADAVRQIDEHRPDLIFLDVLMPGGSGLDVLERMRHPCAVVFTTAHDEYAVTAFELLALDYLLKPFSHARFHRTLARVRDAVGTPEADVPSRARLALTAAHIRRVFVRERGQLISIALADVVRVEGSDDYAALIAGGRTYLLHRRLSDLETALASDGFLRIHRSCLINLRFVTSVRVIDGGRAEVLLADGATVVSSRNRTPLLRARVAAFG